VKAITHDDFEEKRGCYVAGSAGETPSDSESVFQRLDQSKRGGKYEFNLAKAWSRSGRGSSVLLIAVQDIFRRGR
jgi:hypothetical protein